MSTYVEGGETVTRKPDRGKDGVVARTTPGLVLLYAAEYAIFPRAIAFAEPQTVVGRTPPAGGVALPQEAISRVHARFTLHDGVWHAADLNSRNGTLVGGRRITEIALRAGDIVQVGDALFVFVDDGIEHYAAYRIDGAVDPPHAPSPIPELVGGFQSSRLAAEMQRIAPSDLSVLITGETGTGKEIAARSIHRMSGRTGRLVVVNCTAASAAQIERELGAIDPGRGDTLLFDEVGDMPMDAQAKLLHMIVESAARGGDTRRLVSTTHHDLRDLVNQSRFRADLYARLGGCHFGLPPLRARKEDLYALVMHLLRANAATARGVVTGVSFEFMVGLCHYDWPFNVRELENVVRWSLATTDDGALSALPETIVRASASTGTAAPSPDAASAKIGALVEADVRALLQKYAGNVSAVARELRKDRAQLHRWMREHGIRPDDYRET